MKYTTILVGIALSASTAFASAAAINTSSVLTFVNTDGTLNADFGHTFAAADKGKTFADEYTFTIAAAELAATLSAPITKVSDLSFSAFDLYSSTGAKLATGDLTVLGKGFDFGSIASSFGAGSYTLEIAGTVLGSGGGTYTGNMTVSAVPEPETWGMTLSGLAVVGLLARRRQKATAKIS